MGRAISASRRARRRAVAAAVLAAAVGLFGLASPAGAEDLTVTGDLRLVGWFAPIGTACGDDVAVGLDLAYDGAGTSDVLSDMTAHVTFCAVYDEALPSVFAVVDGAFTFTTARGTLTGDVVDGFAPRPIRLVFAVTGGTGDFVGATGSLVFDGDGGLTEEGFVHSGPLTGTISLPDRPRSTDDCKGGGWHDLVDDGGLPFANQGQCVSWANHHL